MQHRGNRQGRYHGGHGLAFLLNKKKSEDRTRTKKHFLVAIAGNPNAGKTSVFNSLTGQHQHVGNYPGVTVDKKTGYLYHGDLRIDFVDLPGTYSLSAFSIEELVARDFVLLEKPDLIVDVLDSTNLERNLYLLLQLQELGVPVIGVLNMSDEAHVNGIRIRRERLERLLGIKFVKTVGNKGKGIDELVDLITQYAAGNLSVGDRKLDYGPVIESERQLLNQLLATDEKFFAKYHADWVTIKLMEGDEDAIRKVEREHHSGSQVLSEANDVRRRIAAHFNDDASIAVGEQRYAFIHGVTRQAVRKVQTVQDRINITETVDRIVLNRYAGIFIFFLIMFLVYQFTFAIGNPLSDLVDLGFAKTGSWLNTILPEGIVRDLLIDGVIGGVGGVLVFFPLVMLLFLGLSFLEDTGYLARAAFVMDKFFQIFGLHGRSFIPFMIATGCAVPAVMSARTLSNKRDRTITVMVVPLMICGAKSPVIAMLSAAFFPKNAGLVFWLMWFLSWLLAVVIALILTKVMFKGKTAPFVMELPPYRMPTFRGVFHHMWAKSLAYIKKAGTIILVVSVVVWFLLNFPKPNLLEQAVNGDAGIHEQAQIDDSPNAIAQQNIESSFAGKIGYAIEPVLKPAGFDWRIGIALFAGFAAKEVIISTMGIVYGIGEVDAGTEGSGSERTPLKKIIANDPRYSRAMALALMVFVMIYLPCMSVLAVVKKELGSWFWPLFQAGYTLVVAWGLAVMTYQLSVLIGIG